MILEAEGGEDEGGDDPLMRQALALVEEQGTISTSMLQRKLRIGFNRAAHLLEQIERKDPADSPIVLDRRPRYERASGVGSGC